MDRKKFIQDFARRLTHLMQKAGFSSNRLGTKLNINKLAEISGCSYQMARRYALGQALPELNIVFKIANSLMASPSWLLFGEDNSTLTPDKTFPVIEISPDLLKYILTKSATLFMLTESKEEIINFITDVIYDASHLNTDVKTIYKIIDMMINSATLFKSEKLSKKTCAI